MNDSAPDSAAPPVIRSKRRGATLVVTLDRPDRLNAMTPTLFAQLQAALAGAFADRAVANIVLHGAGGFFSAGGDLAALARLGDASVAERAALIERLHTIIRSLRAAPKPVIAAIEGGAAGAGASLAFATHLIVAAADSFVALSYIRAGLVPDGGATGFLHSALPRQLAAEMALFGDPVPVERLATLGVINRVVPKGQALEVALELAARLAAGPREAQAAILGLLVAPGAGDFTRQLEREKGAMTTAMGSREAAIGIAAFQNKQVPDFSAPDDA